MLSVVVFVMRLLGLAEYAEGLLAKRALAKKAQDFANMPTTKQERTNAADRGDL